jgi:RNA polymerase sigma-70 factor (ECF subfamily)
MNVEDASDAESLARAAGGDLDAWGALLAQNAERLRRVASFRLNPRLQGRIDAADVLQETFIAATERRAEFFQEPGRSLFLWLRWMLGNTLLDVHRHHLDARGCVIRDANSPSAAPAATPPMRRATRWPCS